MICFQVLFRKVAVGVRQAGQAVQVEVCAHFFHVGADFGVVQLRHAVKDQLEFGALHADAEQPPDGHFVKRAVVEGRGPVAQQAQAGVGQLLFGRKGGDQRADLLADGGFFLVAVDGPALPADALDGGVVHHGAAQGVGPQPLLPHEGGLVGGPQDQRLAQFLRKLAAHVVAREGADDQQHHVHLAGAHPGRAGGGFGRVGDDLGVDGDLGAGQFAAGPLAVIRVQGLGAFPGPAPGESGDEPDVQSGMYHIVFTPFSVMRGQAVQTPPAAV